MATIHEYRKISPSLARITCTMLGGRPEDKMNALAAACRHCATPVRGSFTPLGDDTYVGFVSLVREVRPVEGPRPEAANYRELAGNIFMDNADESLWQLKDGAGGRYLARQGTEDLSSLLETARVSPTGSTPRIARIESAAVATHNFVAFVRASSAGNEVDYGFCVEAAEGRDPIVLSSSDNRLVPVPSDVVVSVVEIARDSLPKVPRKVAAQAANLREKAADASDPRLSIVDYYKLAYSYAPDYVEKIIQQINDLSI